MDLKEQSKTPKQPKKAKSERGSLTVHLDIVFSLYIRLRDAMPGGQTICISCGHQFPFEQMQCGHYYGRRSLSTRWDEDNCHSECCFDNCSNPNHFEGYTKNLIAKIGQERVEALRIRSNETRKWSRDELKELIANYTAEVKRLSKEKDINVKI